MWYCPWAATYDAARQTFIKAFQHFPQIIVYCAGFSVVVVSIRFAQEVGLHPVYRSGGHNAGGYSVSDEMVIDLSNISYLRIDPKKESDLAGAGVNFGGVNPEMDLYGAACAGRRLPDGLRRRLHRGPRLRLHLSAVRYELRLGDGYADGVDGRADCEGQRRRAPRPFLGGGTGNNFGALLEIESRLQKTRAGLGLRVQMAPERRYQAATTAEAFDPTSECIVSYCLNFTQGCTGECFFVQMSLTVCGTLGENCEVGVWPGTLGQLSGCRGLDNVFGRPSPFELCSC